MAKKETSKFMTINKLDGKKVTIKADEVVAVDPIVYEVKEGKEVIKKYQVKVELPTRSLVYDVGSPVAQSNARKSWKEANGESESEE